MANITANKSGNPVMFKSIDEASIRSLKVHFAPVQAGSGDPSPSNIRPISGWDGLTMTRCGKNLFNGANYIAGELVPIHIAVGTPVTVSIKAITGNTSQVRYYDANQTQIDYWTLVYDSTLNRSVKSFSIINRDCEYVAITSGSINEPQLELGSTATPYEPYVGTTIPINWESAGTVYGGYVDLVNGEVIETIHGYTFTGAESINTFSTLLNAAMYSAQNLDGAEWASKSGGVAQVCNYAVAASRITIGNYPNTLVVGDTTGGNKGMLFLKIDGVTSGSAMKMWLKEKYDSGNPLIAVYELATPITITTLTPTQLSTLRGQNTIVSTANGTIDAEYDLHEAGDIAAIRRRVNQNAPHIVTSTPASVATFNTDMVGKLRSAKFNFLPVQNLHGYDSPWPAGGGKNLFDYSKATFATSVPSYGIAITVNAPIITISGTFSQTITHATFNVVTNYSDDSLSGKSYICQAMDVVGGTIVGIWGFRTATEKAIGINIGPHNEGDTVNISFKLSVAASSQTAWSPYSNICPISGWTGANVSRIGKNLFDKDNANILDCYISGVDFKRSGSHKTIFIPCKPNTTYVVSNSANNRRSCCYTAKLPAVGESGIRSVSGGVITTNADARYLAIYCWNGTSDTVTFDDVLNALQIELGSTATPYVPYTGSTYPVSWQSAGMIYGGYVDVVRGEVVAEWGTVDLGTLNWNEYNGRFYSNEMADALPGSAANRYDHIMCSEYKAENTAGMAGLVNYGCSIDSGRHIQVRNDNYTDAASLKAAMSGVMLAYELATPIHCTLTPQIIKSLRGTNNIWSDANGPTTVSYWTH